MNLLIDGLSWAFAVVGCFFLLAGSVGMLRMPDLFTRIHAASLVDTLGPLCIFGALILQSEWDFGTLKLVAIVLALLITNPATTHALCKVALHHSDEDNGEN